MCKQLGAKLAGGIRSVMRNGKSRSTLSDDSNSNRLFGRSRYGFYHDRGRQDEADDHYEQVNRFPEDVKPLARNP
jgi:hypothetical protein